MALSRRRFLNTAAIVHACLASRFLMAQGLESAPTAAGNFHFIYNDRVYRSEFYNFLVNVFHLYPQDELHRLIEETSAQYRDDESVYRELQASLDGIKPFLADLTYAIPALNKQKRVMAEQTRALLPPGRRFNGYLEVGSNGRYLDNLEETVDVDGDIFFMSDYAPTMSPVDMVDRGSVTNPGEWIALNNYDTALSRVIPPKSIDLATVYIGFHHCPLDLRGEFITSIRDVLTDNGVLVLRDHDVYDDKMYHVVALAHDVFNMGTNETWDYNARELRLFYSLAELDRMLGDLGFKSDGRRLLQPGDPTLNTLMLYRKA